jgi:predicted  nucleic acid-binding Zn-ribbon protein
MELLIPGLILVGLMAYLSTRIKKSAAAAFEPERVETDEFYLLKPEGFLYPLNSRSGLPFEAYTKEFGEDEARKIRHARAELTIHEGAKLDEVLENVKKALETVALDEASKQGNRRVEIVDGPARETGVEMAVFHKIVESEGRVYDLKLAVLEEQKDAYVRRIEEMRDSFTVK